MNLYNLQLKLLLFLCMPMFLWSQDRPNVLWLTIEDTSPQFIGCYGNDVVSTPNIDQLASEGIRFSNAFSTGTVCSPSRSAIITGVPTYKLGSGNHRSAYPIPADIHGFPYFLKEAGYYTSNNYKTDYNVANAQQMIEESWHESSGQAGWWNRGDNQPFFSVFNFNDSHQSRTMTMPYAWYDKNVLQYLDSDEITKEDEFDMPPFYNDSPEMRRQFARVYNSIKLTDKKIGDLLDRLKEDGLYENTIIFLFADHGEGIPRGKTNGINLGYRVPFIIRIPAKYQQLSPWDEEVVQELISFEDLAPTLISLAGAEQPEYLKGRILLGSQRSAEKEYLFLSSDRADNGIDLVRSITDGRYVYSRNFMPFMPEVKDIRYINIGEITQEMKKDHMEGVLSAEQSQLFHKREPEVLFDISSDLWEMENLINEEDHRARIEKMRSQMHEAVMSNRDVLFLPESVLSELPNNQSAYEFRQDEDLYNLDGILDCAMLSGYNDSSTVSQLITFLNDRDPIISYWAGVGLMYINEGLLEAYKGPIHKALISDAPLTVIYSSALAYKHFRSEEATSLLKEFILSDNPDLALHTINLLLYIENTEPFIDTVMQLESKKDLIYKVKAAALDFLTPYGLVAPDRQN